MVDVPDVITPFKFGDDRVRGFGLAEGQILHFPIDFEGRPYNTHTIVWGVILYFIIFKVKYFNPVYSSLWELISELNQSFLTLHN